MYNLDADGKMSSGGQHLCRTFCSTLESASLSWEVIPSREKVTAGHA